MSVGDLLANDEPSPWRARLVRTPLGRRIDRAIFQPRGAEPGEVVLNQRRVFILPTRAGLLLSVMLIALLLGSINYSLSLGFALTFLVVGVAWVGMLLTFRNLVHLRLRPVRVEPVFVGEPAEFRLVVANGSRFDRFAIELVVEGGLPNVACDPPAAGEADVVVSSMAARRGRMAMPRVTLVTRFPLGLWRAWSYWQPALVALVYPRPADPGTPLPAGDGEGRDAQLRRVPGSDDFAGLRPYAKGDAVRHIAWRAMARDPEGHALTKLFDGGASGDVVLTLDAARAIAPGLEGALSLLARWVLDADSQGLRWSLELDGVRLRSASGPAHRVACLEALALHGA